MTEAEIDADLKAALAIEWAHYRSIVIQDKIYYANALDEQSKKAFAMAFAAGAKWASEKYQAALDKA